MIIQNIKSSALILLIVLVICLALVISLPKQNVLNTNKNENMASFLSDKYQYATWTQSCTDMDSCFEQMKFYPDIIPLDVIKYVEQKHNVVLNSTQIALVYASRYEIDYKKYLENVKDGMPEHFYGFHSPLDWRAEKEFWEIIRKWEEEILQ
jgi:hypothetical protein